VFNLPPLREYVYGGIAPHILILSQWTASGSNRFTGRERAPKQKPGLIPLIECSGYVVNKKIPALLKIRHLSYNP
jgi:hypothetical protein